MKPYNFTVTLTTPKGHMILIDPEQMYGCWEYPDGGEGGGLWFALYQPPAAVELIDYDGVYELPEDIVEALRGAGYFLDESFD